MKSFHAVSRVVGVATLAVSAAAGAGGFAVDGQDAAAAGMADAATARLDSPSALFYNPGGAAFLSEQAYAFGAVWRAAQDVSFEPVEDVAGSLTSFGIEDPDPLLPHGYFVQPLRERLNFGVAVTTPFDLDTSWQNADEFPGRTTSLSSRIRTLDATVSLAGRFGDRLGVGIGVVARASNFSLVRRVQTFEPLSGEVVDFAELDADTTEEIGLGWTFGMLHRAGERFCWGFSYRSEIEIDYGGNGSLRQIPTGNSTLDEALASVTPFDQDLPFESLIGFPDVASVGVGLQLHERLYVEADVNWTGWSLRDDVRVAFTTLPTLGSTIPLRFDDALTYRVGAELTTRGGTEWRLGYAFDESPQLPEDMNSFLLTSDRNVVTVGIGKDWLQVAAQWTVPVRQNRGSGDFFGSLEGQTWQLSVTLKKKIEELPELP